MVESTMSSTETSGQPPTAPEPGLEPVDPRQAFRTALGRYHPSRLTAIAQPRNLPVDADRPGVRAAELSGQLDSPAAVSRQVAGLGLGSRLALSLFALSETTVGTLSSLSHAIACLGTDFPSAVLPLLERGLLALDAGSDAPLVDDFAQWLEAVPTGSILLRVHPAVPQVVRVPRPEGQFASIVNRVVQVRESDGLEPILRLGALWQRVGVEPLRQTQQGTLYKRDQERIDEDTVLSAPVSDAPVSLNGLAGLWLALGLRVGVIRRDPSGDRLEAADADYWADNAVHLPQMIATSWFGLRGWREISPRADEPPDLGLPAASLRPVVLLWLSCLGEDEWVAIDDLAAHLRSINPRWDIASFRTDLDGARPSRRPRVRAAASEPRPEGVLGPLLLGAGYALGLIRIAEEPVTARRVVQLTSLGRYVLAMGPPPPPRPNFDQFLFVQPNLEIIAYRQGLTPQLAGRLSRLAWWTKLGAALELKLTQESIHFGLEGSLTSEAMLDLLNRHSQRVLPTVVPDAIRRWTERRDQITFYTAATLMEFGSSEDRDLALAAWETAQQGTFVPVADRFLLVENPNQIPNDQIRTGGARDYRHPPEKCVSIQPDGITLVLDPIRTDLLIDAELSQIADELTAPRGVRSVPVQKRYVISSASLKRAHEMGITSTRISEWFERRCGEAPSPAIRLLLRALNGSTATLDARRLLVLTTPTEELADGLLQHPATVELLGERLGPRSVAVPEQNIEPLRRVLKELGLRLPT